MTLCLLWSEIVLGSPLALSPLGALLQVPIISTVRVRAGVVGWLGRSKVLSPYSLSPVWRDDSLPALERDCLGLPPRPLPPRRTPAGSTTHNPQLGLGPGSGVKYHSDSVRAGVVGWLEGQSRSRPSSLSPLWGHDPLPAVERDRLGLPPGTLPSRCTPAGSTTQESTVRVRAGVGALLQVVALRIHSQG